MVSLEFEVAEISEKGLVLGRNGRADIPTGFVFTSIQKLRIEGQHEGLHSVSLGEICAVNLCVEEIHWYRRVTAVVPGGHTAGLGLSGEGITELRDAFFHCKSREYLKLTGILNSF